MGVQRLGGGRRFSFHEWVADLNDLLAPGHHGHPRNDYQEENWLMPEPEADISMQRTDIADDMDRAVAPGPEGAVLSVRVIPRAGSSRIAGLRDGALLIRLAAAPVDGAANEALSALLAKVLAMPIRSITISSGVRSRNKRVTVRADPASIRRRIIDLLQERT